MRMQKITEYPRDAKKMRKDLIMPFLPKSGIARSFLFNDKSNQNNELIRRRTDLLFSSKIFIRSEISRARRPVMPLTAGKDPPFSGWWT